MTANQTTQTRRADQRCHERGTALIVAMLFSMIVAAYSASLLSSGMAVHNQSRTLRSTLEAQQVAESGVHAAVALLNGPGATEFMAAGSAQGSLQGDGERAPRYRLEVTSGAADGIDNDSDLLVDEEDEVDLAEIVSTGSFDGVTKTVRCTLLARYRSPTVQSAAYISNAAAFMSFFVPGLNFVLLPVLVAAGTLLAVRVPPESMSRPES